MIYLLEDDDSIRELVSYTLTKSGMEAQGFPAPSKFYEALDKSIPELILLDIMLPEEDGLSILKKLRSDAKTESIPIIMLTAKGDEYNKVIALDNGADDYITKPFGIMELIARVKAVLRRSSKNANKSTDVYKIGNLTINVAKHEVLAFGKPISLTYKEFELLLLLVQNKGLVLGREKILSEVWGYDFGGESRTVDVHVRTLRGKLGELSELIETVRGVGYKIEERE